jgi:hypothetical protein
MPDPRFNSPSFERVRQIADLALTRSEGVKVNFTLDRYKTMKNCEHAARGFQTSFTSLRARLNRVTSRLAGESETLLPRYSDAQGPYATLMCQREKLDDRVVVFIGPAQIAMSNMEVVDAATGEPMNFGAHEAEKDRLAYIAARTPGKLSQAEYDRLGELVPGFWDSLTGGEEPWWPRPGGAKEANTSVPPPEPQAYDGNKLPTPPASLAEMFGKGVDTGNEREEK